MRLIPLLAAALAASATTPQVATLDEGSFTIYVNNERVGREQFSIRRFEVGGPVELRSFATITRGEQRTEPTLVTDTTGRPLTYELKVRVGTTVTRPAWGVVRGARFSGQIAHGGGKKTERDLPLTSNALVLDTDVVHHYYFVARAAEGESIMVVVPRTLTRDSVRVALRGNGNVEISNGTIPSRHLTVTASGGDVTDLWVDAAGRVLRVHAPARGFTAVRDEAPR